MRLLRPAGAVPNQSTRMTLPPADLTPVASDTLPDLSAFDLLDLPVAWADAQGRLLGANAAFASACGRPVADWRGRPMAAVLGLGDPLSTVGDDAPAGTANAASGTSGQSGLAERLAAGQPFAPAPMAGRHADGRPLHGQLAQRLAGSLRVLTLQLAPDTPAADVAGPNAAVPGGTEPRRQGDLLAMAQRLEMATAAAGVGVWNIALTEPPQVHWDQQMRALHGLAPDEPPPGLAAYVQRHVHPDDRASVGDSLALLLNRREGLLDMDLRIIGPDGRPRRLATRSAISGGDGQRHLHGVMLDVTERHATEDRLRRATERAALAARGAGIGTWESDASASEGWWDEQMFHLRGRPPQSGPVPIDEMMAWLHPDDRARQVRGLQTALAVDGPTNTEFRVVWPDGSVRWLASRSTPVRDEAGHTLRRIGINWDVTDARNAAAARQEQQMAQRESQAKSRFLARISHELRTPLNAVLGFSQLLLADTAPGAAPDPATWRRRVEQVQTSGEHLLALIDNVLDLSSLESGELPLALQPAALAPLVESSLPLVELLARAHGVSLHLGKLDGWALADPVRLRQVVLNLLSNGIKYNRPGGRVSISTEQQGDWLLLRVEDNGSGLSEAQLAHLFEPFNRLGRESDGIAGTGIGLAIVQASIKHMGGTVQVRSAPGAGSCFEVSLQCAEPPPGPQAGDATDSAAGIDAGTSPPLPPLPPGGRLLYIEDNEVNLLIVRELMRQRDDLPFLSAPDGGSGLATARAEQPVLILLDMQLPDMDGHEVLRQLRADPATAGIRCIAVSANAMPEDILRAREAGFDDYWTKPLDLTAFMRGINALFGPAR